MKIPPSPPPPSSSSMLPPQRQEESHGIVVSFSDYSSNNDVQKVDLLLPTRKTQKQKKKKKKLFGYGGIPSVFVLVAFLIVGLEIYTSVTITPSTPHKEEQSFLPTNYHHHHHFQEKQQRNVSTIDSTTADAGSSSSSSSALKMDSTITTTSTYNNNNIQPSNQTCTFKNQTYEVPWGIPTFIIGGAQKTATTSLHRYLHQSHPQIVSSLNEEPHFFDWKLTLPFWLNKSFKISDDDYNNIFDSDSISKPLRDDNDERWCYLRYLYSKEFHVNKIINHQLYSFEKTPSYIYNNGFIKRQQQPPTTSRISSNDDNNNQNQSFSRPYLYPNVAKHLRKVCPWLPKVVFVLRNPVDRAYSNYQMLKLQQQRKQQKFNLTSSSKKVLTFGDCIRNEIMLLRQLNTTTAPMFPTKKEQANNNAADDEKTMRLPTYDHPIDEQYWIPSQPFDKIKFDPLGLLQKGMYALQLQYWFHDYPSDKILIINYDELQQANNSSQQVYMKILNFVGINARGEGGSNNSAIADESVFLKRHRVSSTSLSNQQQAPTTQMQDTTRRYLDTFYEPYNDQLANLLGPSWKDVWKNKGT